MQNIQRRRKIRQLEAQRDKLIEAMATNKSRLAQVRAALKDARRKRA